MSQAVGRSGKVIGITSRDMGSRWFTDAVDYFVHAMCPQGFSRSDAEKRLLQHKKYTGPVLDGDADIILGEITKDIDSGAIAGTPFEVIHAARIRAVDEICNLYGINNRNIVYSAPHNCIYVDKGGCIKEIVNIGSVLNAVMAGVGQYVEKQVS